MNKTSKIYVAGHNGLVGSAIVRKLQENGFNNLVVRTSKELDLRDSFAVKDFFELEKPDYVFLAAAKVGGIHANETYPADFIYDNLMIQLNVIHNSYLSGVKKLLFLGSSCIYPKFAKQPIKEEYLMTGELEPTNDAYALAKIVGIKQCQAYNKQFKTNFISCMPTNIYGINDNYHPENSHVIPGLIRRFHEAKINKLPEVVMWGTGKPKREFLFADDLADACIFLMDNYSENEHINIGSGKEITIRELAVTIAEVIGYNGKLVNDTSKPDGTPRKLMDSSRLFSLGWKPKTEFVYGIRIAYEDYLSYGHCKPLSVN
jgi:GDP-L-fucose synthase